MFYYLLRSPKRFTVTVPLTHLHTDGKHRGQRITTRTDVGVHCLAHGHFNTWGSRAGTNPSDQSSTALPVLSSPWTNDCHECYAMMWRFICELQAQEISRELQWSEDKFCRSEPGNNQTLKYHTLKKRSCLFETSGGSPENINVLPLSMFYPALDLKKTLVLQKTPIIFRSWISPPNADKLDL